jgi:hypothetical protein
MSRYAGLRRSISYFAATPEAQLAHDQGADDAVNDLPYPLHHMFECGEITIDEISIIYPLEKLILTYCEQEGPKPWSDETLLFSDPKWEVIRELARLVLNHLPDEFRSSDWR